MPSAGMASLPSTPSLFSELYMLLINCLDGDILEPYSQVGPSSFANQGILMFHDLNELHLD
jgi:hypothetical protein